MNAARDTGLPGAPTTVFEYALRLHRLTPNEPLPRGGVLPRGLGRLRAGLPRDHTRAGVDAAAVLDMYFDHPRIPPRALARRLAGLPAEYRHNEHISRAAREAPAARVRETGRWLIRHGTDAGSVCIGLALLAEAGTADDIPRIQTVGLLGNPFGSLAVGALERLPGGVEALIWLAERVTEWGRVHAVSALCRRADDPAVVPWLLRRGTAEGNFLDSYVVDHIARVTVLHHAVVAHGDDAEVMDTTGRILRVMTYSEGMGTSLRHYPHALTVLEAYVRQVGRLGPTADRYVAATLVAAYLGKESPAWSDDPALKARWDEARASYLALVDRTDWCATAREGLAAGDERLTWIAGEVAPALGLRAFRSL
ncbi:hypothetical protein ACGFMM_28200 [Streptomyces sp. NPDC048604]|uniref:hypothetical protein n=1 Tax=Streptomyces sp. NPDC048604 TaxID=3365578 RepID=UPI0037155B12